MPDVQIVGVLNVTPDSYFDGGQFNILSAAVARAGEMIEEGADIIEIGGESTGPGSKDVSPDKEIERTIDIIKAIKSSYPNQSLSIDTYKAVVASKAIEAGVMMVNDITAGRGDSEMLRVVAAADVDYVMMYSKDPSPRTTIDDRHYDDVIAFISAFLTERINIAKEQGIDRSRIIIDPGMGHFVSAIPEYSFEIIRRLSELSTLGRVFVSPSRKSFLAGPENLPPKDRLPATIKASSDCIQNGATYIRSHDVSAIVAL